MPKRKKIIYFLCTGNACRSQMAEGWGKKYLGEDWHVWSAGIEAHGVNPNAVKAMKEIGIDISNQTSNTIDNEGLNHADLVVTLCGNAKNACPIIPPSIKHVHWEFDDPAGQSWSMFQKVRDEIGKRIQQFAENGQ